jgi:purine-nucleoside phosphorylase
MILRTCLDHELPKARVILANHRIQSSIDAKICAGLLKRRSMMLRELTRADWIDMLQIPEKRIPDVLILRGTRNLRRQRDLHAERFADVLEVGSPNGLFEDLFLARHGTLNIGYASVYGDSMASEITHLFGVLGTGIVIQTGCCGGLQPGVQTGDLVIPGRAASGEGAARYYAPEPGNLWASPELVRATASLVRPVWPYHTGIMFTTSALLAEGREELESWRDAGHAAVDMETATTFAVATHFHMERVSISYAFDNPLTGDTLVDSDEERAAKRARGEDAVRDVLTQVLDYISGRQ